MRTPSIKGTQYSFIFYIQRPILALLKLCIWEDNESISLDAFSCTLYWILGACAYKRGVPRRIEKTLCGSNYLNDTLTWFIMLSTNTALYICNCAISKYCLRLWNVTTLYARKSLNNGCNLHVGKWIQYRTIFYRNSGNQCLHEHLVHILASVGNDMEVIDIIWENIAYNLLGNGNSLETIENMTVWRIWKWRFHNT